MSYEPQITLSPQHSCSLFFDYMNTLPSYRPGLAKRRSRRLRKKLHFADFQELGFEYEVTWQTFPTMDQQDQFLDALIALIESRDLELGGGATSGVVCGVHKNPSVADTKAILDFLSSWPGVQQAEVGAIVDAWYGACEGVDSVLDAKTFEGIPTHDEVDSTPPVKPRIKVVEPGSVYPFYEIPAFVTIAKPDGFVRPQ